MAEFILMWMAAVEWILLVSYFSLGLGSLRHFGFFRSWCVGIVLGSTYCAPNAVLVILTNGRVIIPFA